MNKVLVAYASKGGLTFSAAQAIARTLRSQCLLINMSDKAIDSYIGRLEDYRAVVLGTSMNMGMPHKDFMKFIKRNKNELAFKKLIIFTCGSASEERNQKRIKRRLPRPIDRESMIFRHLEEDNKLKNDKIFELCREADRPV